MAGDRMAVANGIPNGELQKIAPRKQPPKAGSSGLDRNRWGSADNGSGNTPNDRKVVAGVRMK